MSLLYETQINIDALKRWANSLSAENIESIEVAGKTFELDETSKTLLSTQLETFRGLLGRLKDGDSWEHCLYVMSSFSLNAFFKVKNGAIKVGNFYECLIKASNAKTYKKFFKGFAELEIGSIDIYNKDKIIAKVGSKSDLLWHVFYECFVIDDDPEFHHSQVFSNHEQYISLKLFDVENYTEEEISRLVNEILLKLSMENSLDFELFELNFDYRLNGEAGIYQTQLDEIKLEYIPTLYMNNALQTQNARLSYLSFYQVMEYFFVRCQNYAFLNEYNTLTSSSFDHNSLRKVLQKYKNSLTEKEALKLVLKKSIDINQLKTWLQSCPENTSTYCDGTILGIDLSKTDDKIISRLSERIYSYRCSIAHAKGDVDEYLAIPVISDAEIKKELPLMKYLSYEILKDCSE